MAWSGGAVIGFVSGVVTFMWVMRKFMIVKYCMEGSFEDVQKVVKETVPSFEGWSFPMPAWEFYKLQLSKGLKYDNIRNMVMHFVCKPQQANVILSVEPALGGTMPYT